MIKTLADNLKSFLYIWGSFVALVGGVATFAGIDCADCIEEHWEHLTALCVIMSAIMLVWWTNHAKIKLLDQKIDRKTDALSISILKGEVQAAFNRYKKLDKLEPEQLQYLYMLRDKLTYYDINSYTQATLNKLLKKFEDD